MSEVQSFSVNNLSLFGKITKLIIPIQTSKKVVLALHHFFLVWKGKPIKLGILEVYIQ